MFENYVDDIECTQVESVGAVSDYSYIVPHEKNDIYVRNLIPKVFSHLHICLIDNDIIMSEI